MTFTVLSVCAANICRSPWMAVSLERSFAMRGLAGDVVVRSAGVSAAAGEAVCPEITRLAAMHGVSSPRLEQHRSMLLDDELIDGADLILTADRSGRSDIVRRGRPQSSERTFTLREAAQLADAVAPRVRGHTLEDHLRSLCAQMNHSRGLTDLPGVERVATRQLPWRRLEVHTHDIPDSHGDPHAPHRLVFRLVPPTADQLVASLAVGALEHLR